MIVMERRLQKMQPPIMFMLLLIRIQKIDALKVSDKIFDYFAYEFEKRLNRHYQKNLEFQITFHTIRKILLSALGGVYSASKDTLERSKTMSRTELNEAYKNLDIRTSNFVRLV